MASTTASAPTWPGSRPGSRSRSCTPACPTTSSTARLAALRRSGPGRSARSRCASAERYPPQRTSDVGRVFSRIRRGNCDRVNVGLGIDPGRDGVYKERLRAASPLRWAVVLVWVVVGAGRTDMDLDHGLTLRVEPDGAEPVLGTSLELPATAVDVAQFVASWAASCVGADYSNVAVLDQTGSWLRLFHGSFLAPAIADRYTDVPVDAPYPIAAAVRSREPVFLPDLDSYREQFPDILADTIAAGVEATASLPLFGANGACLGSVGFAWADPPPFEPKLTTALAAVAVLCTETLERARRYDEEHQIVVGLQQRMLDDLPECEGVEVA